MFKSELTFDMSFFCKIIEEKYYALIILICTMVVVNAMLLIASSLSSQQMNSIQVMNDDLSKISVFETSYYHVIRRYPLIRNRKISINNRNVLIIAEPSKDKAKKITVRYSIGGNSHEINYKYSDHQIESEATVISEFSPWKHYFKHRMIAFNILMFVLIFAHLMHKKL